MTLPGGQLGFPRDGPCRGPSIRLRCRRIRPLARTVFISNFCEEMSLLWNIYINFTFLQRIICTWAHWATLKILAQRACLCLHKVKNSDFYFIPAPIRSLHHLAPGNQELAHWRRALRVPCSCPRSSSSPGCGQLLQSLQGCWCPLAGNFLNDFGKFTLDHLRGSFRARVWGDEESE